MQVYLFPLYFPYAEVNETFIAEEMRCIAFNEEIQITLVPFKRQKNEKRSLDASIKVDPQLIERAESFSLLSVFSICFRAAFWLFLIQDVLPRLLRFRFPKKILFARFVRAFYIADYLVTQYRSGVIDTSTVLYSYWLDEATAGFYLAERQEPRLRSCLKVSRAHRWDIIEPVHHLPFRKRALSILDKVVVVSESGCRELLAIYPQLESKCTYQYLGVAAVCDRRTGRVTEGRKEFISCSVVTPVKRVKLIYECLLVYAQSHPTEYIHWIHFGDGPLLPELRALVQTRVSNLEIELPGMLPNNIVRSYLAHVEGAIMVHLSLHEGLPIAIQEALSASIPVIATDGGGTREAVDATVGGLLPVAVSPSEFVVQVEQVIVSYSQFALAARQRFEERFQSVQNFEYYYVLLHQWRTQKQVVVRNR